MSEKNAKEIRSRDLEQIFNGQISVSEILSDEALQRRVADQQDDLVDVLRAVKGERLPR